jgi:urease accessory protein
MEPDQLVHILQLTDSLVPVGGYAYSDGLETAAAVTLVRDAEGLWEWMNHYLEASFIPCEGLALLQCVRAARKEDWNRIRAIDRELTALKPAAATRDSSRSIGKRLLSAVTMISEGRPSPGLEQFAECAAPVAYGLALASRGVGDREAILAFGYARLAGMVSAGMRLVAIGHQKGQQLLGRAVDRLPPAAEEILQMEEEPIRSFSPVIDIQQMNHRYLYSRLFRS